MEFLIWISIRTLNTRLEHGHTLWLLNQVETLRTTTTHTITPVILTITQGMLVFILHIEPQLNRCHSELQLKECHVFTLYPEPQLKGYHSEPQLKGYHPKPQLKESQSLVDHTHLSHTSLYPCIISWHCSRAARRKPDADSLAEAASRQAPGAVVLTTVKLSCSEIIHVARR